MSASDPTIYDVFVALGGDENVTDPTIQDLYDAAVALGEGGPGSGEGAGTLPDPGANWEAEHAYAEGDRILVDGGYDANMIVEAQGDGASGTDEPDWSSVGPNESIEDGDNGWVFIGFVDELPFAAIDDSVVRLVQNSDLGLQAVPDPNAFWEAEHEYAAGDRIEFDANGVRLVLETPGGTSGSDSPVFWDEIAANGWIDPIEDGDIQWIVVGIRAGLSASVLAGSQTNGVVEIEDPASATAEDVATAYNALVRALRVGGQIGAPSGVS